MRILILSFLIFSLTGLFTSAQDPVPKLVISEIHMYHTEEAYVEITNMGDQPVDLDRVIFTAARVSGWRVGSLNDEIDFLTGAGILDPGESFVVINHRTSTTDTTDIWTPSWYYEKADYMLYYTRNESHSGMRFTNGDDAFGLFWDIDGDNIFDLAIDTLLDVVGDPETQGITFEAAGVPDASLTHTFIRKFSVKEGNAGPLGWFEEQGVSAEDSKWIVIPYDPWRLGAMFTTVGNHGNSYTWDFSVNSGTVDENNRTITMPWGAWRDSIYRDLSFGPNMGWYLRWGPDTLESNAVQTGDTLFVYLCGDEVEVRKYPITVTEPLEDNNKVISKLTRNDAGNWVTPYLVTDGIPTIDTLYSIPFGTRIDSLLKYLEKAPDATWEIQTFDEAVRAEVMTGDKLIVTAENGDVKEYFIRTGEYSPNDNAYLETILIDQDTLWGFDPRKDRYDIILPTDATRFPSISATTQNNDATVSIKHPSFIRGSEEERTAVIQVTAEDDSTVFNYYISFDFPRSIQINRLDVFFSQVIHTSASRFRRGFEIFNPSNVPVSLADYMMVRARPDRHPTLESVISETDSSRRNFILNFGYYFDNSRSDIGVYFKEATNYIIDLDPFSVFFLKRGYTDHWGGADFYSLKGESVDMSLPYAYGYNDGCRVGYQGSPSYSYWLLKMKNDSILNGTKSADDPDDWEFADIWGAVGEYFTPDITVDGYSIDYQLNQHYIRRGHIYEGNAENFGSILADEWYVVTGEDYFGPEGDVRRHAGFIKPTYFKSTVSSATYLVSFGTGNNESINGVFPGSTVTGFYEKLIKAHPDQVLEVMAGDGSGAKGADDGVLTGDTLVVQSADLENTTRYEITTSFLSPNATLTSDIYNIEVQGTSGTIDSIAPMTTINELLEHLTLPDGAFMNIFDNQRRHVPILHYAPDTLVPIDPVVNDSIFIEVIAEDGATRIVYSLILKEAPEPFIISNVYDVYQDYKVIDFFEYNTNINTFLYNVTPSTGSHIVILDKYDYERTVGNMYIDDRILVTNDIDTIIYTLHAMDDTLAIGGSDTTTTSIRSVKMREGNEQLHSIYPNPATERLSIAGLEPGSRVAVINLLGDIMKVREAWSKKMELDLSGFSNGVYFIRIMKDQKAATYKFVKQ